MKIILFIHSLGFYPTSLVAPWSLLLIPHHLPKLLILKGPWTQSLDLFISSVTWLSHSVSYHLYDDNSQVYISSQNLSSDFQTRIFTDPFDISI